MNPHDDDQIDNIFRAATAERVGAARAPRPFNVLPSQADDVRQESDSTMNERNLQRGILVGALALIVVAGFGTFMVSRTTGSSSLDTADQVQLPVGEGEGGDGFGEPADDGSAEDLATTTSLESLDAAGSQGQGDAVTAVPSDNVTTPEQGGTTLASQPSVTNGPTPDPGESTTSPSTTAPTTAPSVTNGPIKQPPTTKRPSTTKRTSTTIAPTTSGPETSPSTTDGVVTTVAPPSTGTRPPSTTTSPVDDFGFLIGLSVDDASEAAAARGFTIRVTKLDGQDLMVTMDYRTDRVNVEVANGVVVAVIGIG